VAAIARTNPDGDRPGEPPPDGREGVDRLTADATRIAPNRRKARMWRQSARARARVQPNMRISRVSKIASGSVSKGVIGSESTTRERFE
jgi:hypothetical protein